MFLAPAAAENRRTQPLRDGQDGLLAHINRGDKQAKG
jgi:hypothetical protein